MQLKGRVAMVTGASSGIGREVALELGRRGASVALIGRDRQRLEATAEAMGGPPLCMPALCMPADVGNPFAPGDVLACVERRLGPVDVLVNVAGINHHGPFEEHDPGAMEDLLRVNLIAPMLFCRAVLPGMRARGGGTLVNVGSGFGFIGFPGYAAYSASKFGLRGFSEALRRETRSMGVRVVHVAPRGTRTPMALAPGQPSAKAGARLDSPQWVARQIVNAIGRGAVERVLGFPERAFARVNGVFPALFDRLLRGAARDLPRRGGDALPVRAQDSSIPMGSPR